MRRWIRSLFNRNLWPETKKFYQSEIDCFLQAFHATRVEPNLTREQERQKYQALAQRRDQGV